jgi:hypothetical protein
MSAEPLEPAALHAPQEGSAQFYRRGCRCNGCRWAWRIRAREVRMRDPAVLLPQQTVDAGPSRDVLEQLRGAGMTWPQIAELSGLNRKTLMNINRGDPLVTLLTEQTLRYARDRWAAAGAGPGALVDSALADWMIGCLLARGWTARVLAAETGWRKGWMRPEGPEPVLIFRHHEERVRAVFDRLHLQWGPSRGDGARRMWRKGVFFSDCYEPPVDGVPDRRPVPGSLHPDLVAEAGTADRRTKPEVLALLASLGQFPDARCCRVVHGLWEERGRGGPEKARCPLHHTHRLPQAWATGGAG